MKTITNSKPVEVFELPSFPGSIETEIYKKWETDLNNGWVFDSKSESYVSIPKFCVHDRALIYSKNVQAVSLLLGLVVASYNLWLYFLTDGVSGRATLLAVFLAIIFYPLTGRVIGYACGLPLAFVKKRKHKIVEKKKILDTFKQRFINDNDPQFFYAEVIAYLKFKIKTIEETVSKKKAYLEVRFKAPRREIRLEICQGYLDLRNLRMKKNPRFDTACDVLKQSIRILKQRVETLSPDEIDLLNQIRKSEAQIQALNNLIAGLNAKKAFYDEYDHEAVFTRIAKLERLARPDGYQSHNAAMSDPILIALRAELDEINAELRKVIGQAVEVSNRPLLTGATTPVERLIAS